MRKTFRRILHILLSIIVFIILYFVGIIMYNLILNYQPERSQIINNAAFDHDTISSKNTYSILSWNIGYGGLGKNADFFYDGGKMIRPSYEEYNTYWSGIQSFMEEFNPLFDFILLQEVDTASFRSFGTNQHDQIDKLLTEHSGVFIKNYDVAFIPVPLFKPLRNVISGLSSFSHHQISSAELVPFNGNYAWPKSLMMPDRCFLTTTHKLSSGRKLHIINTHNSAFDDGSLREEQLGILFDYIDSLYHKGDYVVAGGDWNVNPPTYENKTFKSKDIPFEIKFKPVIFNEFPEWNVVYNSSFPTNRDVSSTYVKASTPTTIIDYFICSPNINTLEINTLYNGFHNSDHHAVFMKFVLN